MKYKVLKETPFHNVGDVIDSTTFQYYYGWENVSPENFTNEKKKTFFQPIRYEKLPLDFIWNGLIYTKCMDGMYRLYRDSTHYQNMSKNEHFGSIEPQSLFTSINDSVLQVYEIKRLE